jgi:hypothetical protein
MALKHLDNRLSLLLVMPVPDLVDFPRDALYFRQRRLVHFVPNMQPHRVQLKLNLLPVIILHDRLTNLNHFHPAPRHFLNTAASIKVLVLFNTSENRGLNFSGERGHGSVVLSGSGTL